MTSFETRSACIKNLNSYGHKNLSTPMWWCSCKSLNSFKSDSSDFMHGCKWCSDATTQHGSLEERFEEYIKKKFPPDQKHSTNGIIYAGFGEKIINCLKNPRLFSKEFPMWRRINFTYSYMEKPSKGLKDVLVVPLKIWIRQRGSQLYMVHVGYLLLFWLATLLAS